MIKKETDILVRAYNSIKVIKAEDAWDVFSLFFCPLFTVINLITYHLIFFSKYTISFESVDMLGINKYAGSVFFMIGWILIPFLFAIYKRTISTITLNKMMFASFGLYSTLTDTTIFFGLFVAVLVIQRSDLFERIKSFEWFLGIILFKEKHFPKIDYHEKN